MNSLILHSRVEFCGALFICGRDIKLIYPITTYLFYLKVNKFFIVKLEQILITKLEQIKNKSYWSFILQLKQIFVFGGNYSRVVTYILESGGLPPEASEFLSELMYFYWKICYFGHFLYTAQVQPGGGQDFIREGGGPPWPHAGYGPDRYALYARTFLANLLFTNNYYV